MPCIPGKVVSAREAMDDKCTFEMVEHKSPYSESRVKIEGRMGSSRRRKTRRGGSLSAGECIAKQSLYLKNGESTDRMVKQYPECADIKYPGGRRRKSKKAGRRTRRR